MRLPARPSPRVGLPLVAAGLAACTSTDLFRVSGFQQETFSNDADVIFVLDNSGSMAEEAGALAVNLDVFIEQLAGSDGPNAGSEGLPDAVDNYIEFASRRTGFIDYSLGVVTTDPGRDLGAIRGERVEFGEADVVQRFRRNILCESTCWTVGSYGNDPSYQCGEPFDRVTSQLLDCECGADGWRPTAENQDYYCGTGNEEHLESVVLALCRAVPDPPEACFDPDFNPAFDETLVGTNAGLVREGGTVVPVLITDEGDASRRRDGDGDDIPDEYDAIFRAFGTRMAWAVIGPQPGDVGQNCNTISVPAWTVDRYDWFVDQTDGLRLDIFSDEGGECGVADFAEALTRLGALLNALSRDFRLAAVPRLDTVLVFVDGDPVDAAELLDAETDQWSDGWSYDPATNAIVFHGEAVPDFDAQVRIYYLPITGMPRDLPF